MKKVIVQDSDCDLLETLKLILEQGTYEVLTVLHYEDVVSKVATFIPHLILLDFKLNGEGSIGLCHELKKKYPLIPIVALSCNVNIQKEYGKAGFDDYIAKPFDIDHLMTVLQKYTN